MHFINKIIIISIAVLTIIPASGIASSHLEDYSPNLAAADIPDFFNRDAGLEHINKLKDSGLLNEDWQNLRGRDQDPEARKQQLEKIREKYKARLKKREAKKKTSTQRESKSPAPKTSRIRTPSRHSGSKTKSIIHSRNTQVNTDQADNEKANIQDSTRLWNLRNADIQTVIEQVALETGKNFIIDPRVKGKITIVSSTPLNADEIYHVFLSMLQISGYSAVAHGNVVKVIPNVDAKTMTTPIMDKQHGGHGDENVVRIFPIKNVEALKLLPVLRPLLPQWANITAYQDSNMLIISGGAANIERIAKIIKRVDVNTSEVVEIIPLQHATAQELVDTLKSLQGKDRRKTAKASVTIAADDRSNSVLLSGPEQDRLRMRVVISELDTPSPMGANGYTQVISLRYLQATDLVTVLAGIARSHYRGEVNVTVGTRTITEQLSAAPDLSGANTSTSNISTQRSTNSANNRGGSSGSNSSRGSNGVSAAQPIVEIVAEPNTNSIILNAPPELMRTLKRVIMKLDIRPEQVLVEALIAEINDTDIKRLGIDWGSVVDDGILGATGLGSLGFQPGIGIINSNVRNLDQFQGVLTALVTDNRANVLSTPSIVVLDNHEAQIAVGTRVSVQTSSQSGNSAGGNNGTPFNTTDRENVTLHLTVRPQINKGNSVLLTIDHGNDTLQDPDDVSINPVVNTSKINTSVLVNDGDILVLGGLKQNTLRRRKSKIPIIGDLPGIGRLFHNNSRSAEQKNLMVFLRPVILHNRGENNRISKSRYSNVREYQLDRLRELELYLHHSHEFVLPPAHNIRLPVPFSHG